MTDEDWDASHARSLGAFLNGKAIQTPDDRGRSMVDDSFLLLFNAHTEGVEWAIPAEYGKAWRLVLDTARLQPEAEPPQVDGRMTTWAGSMVLLQARQDS
jgi:glycogen operon protein